MKIDVERARAAIGSLAARFQDDPMQAAAAIIAVANSNMARAIRVISVERGFDPRQFTLVAFGGAGGLHACDLADALRIPRVLVPAFQGVLSAFGMVQADVTKAYTKSVLAEFSPRSASAVVADLEAAWSELTARAVAEMTEDGIEASRVRYERALDLRYLGQSYELTVPVDRLDVGTVLDRFHRAHAERYGHSAPDRPVEAVQARLKASAPGYRVEPPLVPAGPRDPDDARIGRQIVWFGEPYPTAVYDRARLRAGNVIEGPAVVVQLDATSVIPPHWSGRVDRWGNLILECR
jgi:N-methylhydantoinase A